MGVFCPPQVVTRQELYPLEKMQDSAFLSRGGGNYCLLTVLWANAPHYTIPIGSPQTHCMGAHCRNMKLTCTYCRIAMLIEKMVSSTSKKCAWAYECKILGHRHPIIGHFRIFEIKGQILGYLSPLEGLSPDPS